MSESGLDAWSRTALECKEVLAQQAEAMRKLATVAKGTLSGSDDVSETTNEVARLKSYEIHDVLRERFGGRDWTSADTWRDGPGAVMSTAVGKTVATTHAFELRDPSSYGADYQYCVMQFTDGSGVACIVESGGFPGTDVTPASGTEVRWYTLAPEGA